MNYWGSLVRSHQRELLLFNTIIQDPLLSFKICLLKKKTMKKNKRPENVLWWSRIVMFPSQGSGFCPHIFDYAVYTVVLQYIYIYIYALKYVRFFQLPIKSIASFWERNVSELETVSGDLLSESEKNLANHFGVQYASDSMCCIGLSTLPSFLLPSLHSFHAPVVLFLLEAWCIYEVANSMY